MKEKCNRAKGTVSTCTVFNISIYYKRSVLVYDCMIATVTNLL